MLNGSAGCTGHLAAAGARRRQPGARRAGRLPRRPGRRSAVAASRRSRSLGAAVDEADRGAAIGQHHGQLLARDRRRQRRHHRAGAQRAEEHRGLAHRRRAAQRHGVARAQPVAHAARRPCGPSARRAPRSPVRQLRRRGQGCAAGPQHVRGSGRRWRERVAASSRAGWCGCRGSRVMARAASCQGGRRQATIRARPGVNGQGGVVARPASGPTSPRASATLGACAPWGLAASCAP